MIFLLLTIVICKYIDIGKTYEDKLLAQDFDIRGHSYYFELKHLKENADILIILSQLTPQGDPNIFVSKVNESPFSIEESELIYCQSLGNDLCVIDKNQLEINTNYYIGITCKGDCYYTLKIDYDFEQYLQMNDIVQFRMVEAQQSNVIKIKLKSIEDMSELQIFGKVVNFYEMENPFYMYLNLGDTLPSSQKYDIKGEANQNGSQIISISLANIKHFQILTLVVEAQIGSIIEIKTKTTSNITKQLSGSLINSYIRENQVQLFEIDNIKFASTTQFFLEVHIEIVFGEIMIGIQIDKQLPNKISDYQYQFRTNQTMIYQIPKYKMNFQYDELIVVIVAIQGIKSSGLQFNVDQNSYGQTTVLQANVLYGSIIIEESINKYYIQTFFYEAQNNYTIKFQTESDNLIVVLRSSTAITTVADANQDQQEIEKKYLNDPNQVFIYNSKNQTQFEYQIFKSESIYYYCISVFQIPGKVQKKSFGYSLYLETSFQSKTLLINTPHKSFGNQSQYSYFNFNLNVTQAINKMIIMVNAIQGKFQIFSSKKQFPQAMEFEKKGIDNIIEYDFKNTIQKQQNFYISVLCEMAGFYMITVALKIDSLNAETYGDYPWEYAQIYQGDPSVFKLNCNKTFELLKIDFTQYQRQIQHKTKSSEFASINLNSKLGGLYIYGFTSPSSITTNAILVGESQINLRSSDFHDDMIVYLRIELQMYHNQSSFQIAYSLKQSILFDISENENYFGCLDYYHQQSFLFQYFELKNYVMNIKNEATDERLRVILDINSTEFDTKESKIFITKSFLIDQNCVNGNDATCFFLLSIKSLQFTFFSVSIKEASEQQQLVLGQTKYLETPTFQNYFYLEINENDLTIIVTNLEQNQKLFIFVTLYNRTNNLEFNQYPQNDSSDTFNNTFVINNDIRKNQVSLSKQEIQHKNCQKKCILAITIQPAEENNQGSTFNLYSILVQPKTRLLSERKETLAQITNEEFQYYQFSNKATQVEIVIKLSGCTSATIFVSKNELPSIENFDWFTDSNEIIIKNKKEKYFDMSGKYFIGVLGQKDECSYKIKYELRELKNDNQVIKQQINHFLPNYLENNQQLFIATQDQIIWQINCSKSSQIIIQLFFLSDIKVEGGLSVQNLLDSKNLSKFTILKKTKQYIFGYFHPSTEEVFFIKTQSQQNYSLRATSIFSYLPNLNFNFGKFFNTFDNNNFSQIETSVDYIQLIQKNISYQIQELQFQFYQIIEDQNLNPALSGQQPLSKIILQKNDPLQQIQFPIIREQIPLNNLTHYLVIIEILITLSSEDVLIIDAYNYYSLILNNEQLMNTKISFSVFAILLITMLLIISYIIFKKKKVALKEKQSLVKMVEMRLKFQGDK